MSKISKRVVDYTEVQFLLEFDLESDSQVMGITGSHKRLGSWSPRHAALAQRVNGRWQVEVKLPSRKVVYYKWAVFQRGTVDILKTEDGHNKYLMIVPQSYRMKVHCNFNGDDLVEEESLSGDSSAETAEQPPKRVGLSNDPGFSTGPNESQVLPAVFTSLEEAYVRPCPSDERITTHTEIEMQLSAPFGPPRKQKSFSDQGSQTDAETNSTSLPHKDQCNQANLKHSTHSMRHAQYLAVGLGIGLAAGILLRKFW